MNRRANAEFVTQEAVQISSLLHLCLRKDMIVICIQWARLNIAKHYVDDGHQIIFQSFSVVPFMNKIR